jgi:hypothetical protein
MCWAHIKHSLSLRTFLYFLPFKVNFDSRPHSCIRAGESCCGYLPSFRWMCGRTCKYIFLRTVVQKGKQWL